MSLMTVRLNKLSSDWQIARAVLEDEYKVYLDKALDRIRTRYEFASHLLDVHRMWCAECSLSGCPAQPVRSDRDTCAAEYATATSSTVSSDQQQPGFQFAAPDMSIQASLRDNNGDDKIDDNKISGTALPLEVACNDEDGEIQTDAHTITPNDKGIKQEHCDDDSSQEKAKDEKQREEGAEERLLDQLPHTHRPDVPPLLDWTNNVSDIHILIKQEECSQEYYDIVMEGSKNQTEWHQGHEEDGKTILGNSEPPRSSYEHDPEAFIPAQSGAGIDEPSKSTHDMSGHSPEEASQDQGNTGNCSINIVQHHSTVENLQSSSKKCFHRSDFDANLKTHSKPKPQSQGTDTGQKLNQCLICKEDFTTDTHLKKRTRTHEEERPYQCTVSHKAFSVSSSLSRHMTSHRGWKPFYCSVCGMAVRTSSHLTIHMRKHTGEKPHVCSVCNKAFSYRTSLSYHMRTHTGDKPYHCTLCNKTFSVSSSLSRHKRTHTGEKPYACSLCNKVFSDGSNFSWHMKIHAEDKPYKCSVCNKAFTLSSRLAYHMITHTKEKPYHCSVCNRAFKSNSHLNSHMRIHTGKKT